MTSSRVGLKSSSTELQEIRAWNKSDGNLANDSKQYHGVESDQIPVVSAEQGIQDIHVPAPPADVLQRWNAPKANMWRTYAAFYSFLILGLAGSAYGVCLKATFALGMFILILVVGDSR